MAGTAKMPVATIATGRVHYRIHGFTDPRVGGSSRSSVTTHYPDNSAGTGCSADSAILYLTTCIPTVLCQFPTSAGKSVQHECNILSPRSLLIIIEKGRVEPVPEPFVFVNIAPALGAVEAVHFRAVAILVERAVKLGLAAGNKAARLQLLVLARAGAT